MERLMGKMPNRGQDAFLHYIYTVIKIIHYMNVQL